MSHSQPQTYKSKSGKTFCYDAREIIAIDDIDTKCDAIVEAASEGCKKICKDMKNVNLGKEALCVADSSLEPAVDELSDYIKSIATEGVKPVTDQFKGEAAKVFEEKQKEEDARAKKDCEAEDARWQAEQDKKNNNS